ncbi:hypothetical protein BaRGS_00020710 [Batillaria attramentaria]|uniref:Uncharacterized protein n=1 Tax=Batillaria attramentaria TaxID=370345 RepID=A0ABD0KLX8_9CAEN
MAVTAWLHGQTSDSSFRFPSTGLVRVLIQFHIVKDAFSQRLEASADRGSWWGGVQVAKHDVNLYLVLRVRQLMLDVLKACQPHQQTRVGGESVEKPAEKNIPAQVLRRSKVDPPPQKRRQTSGNAASSRKVFSVLGF